MTTWDPKRRVDLAGISVEVPAALFEDESRRPIDSLAASLHVPGLSVVVDQGPFADDLASYAGRPGYERRRRQIAGRDASVISARGSDEGTYVVAAHFPELNGLTIAVQADDSVPIEVARAIVESIRPGGEPRRGEDT